MPLLGGLSPAQFMRRYWQKKPLLIRSAIPGFRPLLSRARLFALAARADVESRVVVRRGRKRWTLEHGPLKRAARPSLAAAPWTLLVQGVDLHDDSAHTLLQSFRFVPDARLDDLMISWASPGGGVGPHVDSYDVFLLQAQGRRRWRIGRTPDPVFDEAAPLKILKRFVAEDEHVLEPGDMLYLPPDWGHDGVADGGACMTYSIGFRAPRRTQLATELAQRLTERDDDAIFRDPQLGATRQPGEIPRALRAFAADALRRLVRQPDAFASAVGEVLSEPAAGVAFDEPATGWASAAVVLDRRTRMLYDDCYVFINGDSYRATGLDAKLMRRLADERCLDRRAVRGASVVARALLREWFGAGWLHRGAR